MADTTPLFLPNYCRYTGGRNLRAWNIGTVPASTAWGTANLAIYLPFSLPFTYVAARMAWRNGTVVSGNVSIGIYNAAGTNLYASAATVQAGTSARQYVTLGSPLTLTPGHYFMALAASSATATFFASTVTAIQGREGGLYQEALGGLPLGATATVAQWAQVFYPIMTITRTTTGY